MSGSAQVRKSTLLSKDLSILKVVQKINPVENYCVLARALLGNEPKVASILGKQTTDFREIVYKIFIKWRNATGNQPETLLKLFKKLELDSAREHLVEELEKDPKFIAVKDSNLYTLASKISCVTKHRAIGLELGINEFDLENIIGVPHVDYETALYKVFIEWRNAHSGDMETFHKLQTILKSHGQKEASDYMDKLEKEGWNQADEQPTRNTDDHTMNEDRTDGCSSAEIEAADMPQVLQSSTFAVVNPTDEDYPSQM